MRANSVTSLITSILLLIASTNISFGMDCGYDTYAPLPELERLYSRSNEVVYVQITKGELIENEVIYSAKVIKNLKGEADETIELTGLLADFNFGMRNEISVGKSYVIYLTSSREIGSCTPLFPVRTPDNTTEELIKFSERVDLEHSREVRKTLNLSNIIEGK